MACFDRWFRVKLWPCKLFRKHHIFHWKSSRRFIYDKVYTSMLFIVILHLFAQLVLGSMTSVLFCDVGLPNIDNIDDVEKTLFFYHQPNWHCVRHNIATGTTIAWGFIVLVAGIFAFWPLLFPSFFFKVTLICLKSKLCILSEIKTSMYLPRWPLGTAKSLDPSV